MSWYTVAFSLLNCESMNMVITSIPAHKYSLNINVPFGFCSVFMERFDCSMMHCMVPTFYIPPTELYLMYSASIHVPMLI